MEISKRRVVLLLVTVAILSIFVSQVRLVYRANSSSSSSSASTQLGKLLRRYNITQPTTKTQCTVFELDSSRQHDKSQERQSILTVVRERQVGGQLMSTRDNLYTRISSAIARFGPLPRKKKSYLAFLFDIIGSHDYSSSAFVFDFSSQDLPACDMSLLADMKRGDMRKNNQAHCHEVAKNCCNNGRPLFGASRNICCPCTVPLPIHSNQRQSYLETILAHNDTIAWHEKIPQAIWRGSPTGKIGHIRFYANHFAKNSSRAWDWQTVLENNDTHWEYLTPRRKIVRLAQQYPHLLNASFRTTNWNDLLKYKYIVSVSGHAYAGLLKQALISNSCVLRQDPIATEWYEDWLVPWVHHVPVRYDLSSICLPSAVECFHEFPKALVVPLRKRDASCYSDW